MGLFAGTEFDLPAHCDDCGRLESECECPPPPPFRLDPSSQTATIKTEKRKKGKVVTLISGLPAEGNDLPGLLTELKNTCGAGGTVSESGLELQGKHVQSAASVLKKKGFKVKQLG